MMFYLLPKKKDKMGMESNAAFFTRNDGHTQGKAINIQNMQNIRVYL